MESQDADDVTITLDGGGTGTGSGTAGSAGTANKVQVVVRVRPKISIEREHNVGLLTTDVPKKRVLLKECTRGSTTLPERAYSFDGVFDQTTTQADFFHAVGMRRMVDAVLDGYNCTVFAYGQTGSGKTFTMEGYNYEVVEEQGGQWEQRSMPRANLAAQSRDTSRLGLVPRTVQTLFEQLERRRGAVGGKRVQYSVKCSFLQIYNEQVYDLLNATHLRTFGGGPGVAGKFRGTRRDQSLGPGLRVRWSKEKEFYVENLFYNECTTPDQVMSHFHSGLRRKIMASHKMNAASSRSHCLFTLYIDAQDLAKPENVVRSQLALVDLAGSERVGTTDAKGQLLQESIGINRSLFVLRQVITALATDNVDTSHVPYRDCKLTSLLKHSLGGNSLTLMIACCSPSDVHLEENVSTLTYAARAQQICNRPIVNEDPHLRLIRRLRQEIASLREQLVAAQAIAAAALQQQQEGRPASSGAMMPRTMSPVRTSHATPTSPSAVPSVVAPAPATTAPATFEAKATARLRSQVQAAQEKAKAAEAKAEEAAKREAAAMEALNRKQSLASQVKKEAHSVTLQLKRNILDNVDMIKRMFETEQFLRTRVDEEIKARENLESENTTLNLENRELRDKVEVLQYLLEQYDASAGAPVEVPGYGTVAAAEPRSAPPSRDAVRSAGVARPPAVVVPQSMVRPRSFKQTSQESPPMTPVGAPVEPDIGPTGNLSVRELTKIVRQHGQQKAAAKKATKPNGPAAPRTAAGFPLAFEPGGSMRGRHTAPAAPAEAWLARPSSEPGAVEVGRVSTTGRVLHSSQGAQEQAASAIPVDDDPYWDTVSPLDPAEAMAELNELLRARARLRQSGPIV